VGGPGLDRAGAAHRGWRVSPVLHLGSADRRGRGGTVRALPGVADRTASGRGRRGAAGPRLLL
jgi:hypothetical protein